MLRQNNEADPQMRRVNAKARNPISTDSCLPLLSRDEESTKRDEMKTKILVNTTMGPFPGRPGHDSALR
jgi:hypothetical protein